MNGKGIYTWPSGDKYFGNYFKSKKNGYGIYQSLNGLKYEGKWE